MLVRFGDHVIINLDKLIAIENKSTQIIFNSDTNKIIIEKYAENTEECENALNLLRKIIPDLLTSTGRTVYLRNLGEMSKLFLSKYEQSKEK